MFLVTTNNNEEFIVKKELDMAYVIDGLHILGREDKDIDKTIELLDNFDVREFNEFNNELKRLSINAELTHDWLYSVEDIYSILNKRYTRSYNMETQVLNRFKLFIVEGIDAFKYNSNNSSHLEAVKNKKEVVQLDYEINKVDKFKNNYIFDDENIEVVVDGVLNTYSFYKSDDELIMTKSSVLLYQECVDEIHNDNDIMIERVVREFTEAEEKIFKECISLLNQNKIDIISNNNDKDDLNVGNIPF